MASTVPVVSMRTSHIYGRARSLNSILIPDSACGYDHAAVGSKKRLMPVAFTGCLAHAEIIYEVQTHHVSQIRGHFTHNDECSTTEFSRIPTFPIHPSVYVEALQQLKAGMGLDKIKERNQAMYESRTYRDMPHNLQSSPYRWILENSDTRSLYRQFFRLQGIKIAQKDHINVHEWLNPDSPQFNQTLRDAIFHYKPRVTQGERIEVCISTPEMKEAAWKYAHHSQVLLDGTFGITIPEVRGK